MEAVLKLLWELPHRGSATPQEAQAAEKLKQHLENQGHTVQVQSFAAPRSYGPELIAISGLLALGGWLWWPLGLLGMVGFVAHFSGWKTLWSGWFDRYRSQNLIAQAGSGRKTLLLMAHYDSAKTFFVYNPSQVKGFRANFLLNTALALLLVPLAWLWPLGAKLVGSYFLLQALLLLHREATAPFVNGANDNATGVAVATALFQELAAQPPANWQVMLALTGCEEVGTKGAFALAQSGLVPSDAWVLNIDNVGRGELFFAVGEGMLLYQNYQGELVQAAHQLGQAQALEYRLAYFDARAFMHTHPCLTLIRLEAGLPPNWHWPSDVASNVNPQDVQETLNYARRLLKQAMV